MKILSAILIVLVLSVNCREQRRKRIIPSDSSSSEAEPGFECDGGLVGVFNRYLHQREVHSNKTMLSIFGHCISNPEFNHRLIGEMSKIPMTMISLPDKDKLSPVDAPIFTYTIMYYCQYNTTNSYYKQMIKNMETLMVFRSYVLFTMVKGVKTTTSELASIRSCEVLNDHQLLDKFFVEKIKRNWLAPQTHVNSYHDVCGVGPGRMQTHIEISFDVKIKDGNCTLFERGKPQFPTFTFVSFDRKLFHMLLRRPWRMMREFNFLQVAECVKPMAIVEPSEWALIAPLSRSFAGLSLLSILTICWISSLASVKEYKSLLYQVIMSIVTPQPVSVPQLHGLFQLQRLLLMGLFILLLQTILVNNFRTEFVSELMEPDRNLKMFNNSFMFTTLPYRYSPMLFKGNIYQAFIQKGSACLADVGALKEALNIPLAKTDTRLSTYGMVYTTAKGNLLRPSRVAVTLSEHGLMPIIRRYINKYKAFDDPSNPYVRWAKQVHRANFPDSPWSPDRDWEALKQFLAECIGVRSCEMGGGPQSIVMHNSEMSLVFRMEHLRGTIWFCSFLLLISSGILIGEMLHKCYQVSYVRNSIKPYSRTN